MTHLRNNINEISKEYTEIQKKEYDFLQINNHIYTRCKNWIINNNIQIENK